MNGGKTIKCYMQKANAIVIGAGIAGIAAAIRLAVKGYSVTVFEKNEYPGGKMSSFEKSGYFFDAGPSLFTQPFLLEELFKLADEPIEDYFTYQKMSVNCNYFYEDGIAFQASADKEEFARTLQEHLGEDPQKINAYLDNCAKMYHKVGDVFLNHSLHKRKTLFSKPTAKALSAAKLSWLANTMHSANKKYFKHPHTVQLFNRYATYNGSSPYKAPAMLTLIPHLEFNEGVFYPKGGMIAITNALYKLAIKKGVIFILDTKVQRIIQHEEKVSGVVAASKNHYADIVVSNMDVYFTYKYLLNQEQKSQKILKQERSSSAFIFYWGIRQTFNQLGLHNILFSDNYEKEFEALFQKHNLYKDPTVYINITSKCEPGIMAPAGKENWFVMINVPANRGQDWMQIKQEARKKIIQKINRVLKTDIEQLIEVEEILDPIQIENKTDSYMGSLYGTSSNSKMAAFLRHPNFSKNISGLYFVGGSVHPGGGIPLCLRSAKIATDLINE